MPTTLHFAHANGFVAGTYSKMLGSLGKEFNVIAIEKLGHDPRYPVDDNWVNLTQELIDYLEGHAKEPVIGVGHSLGGIVTFLAAYRRPERVRQIVVVEPALAYGPIAFGMFLVKRLGIINHFKVVTQTKRRRDQWSSRQEAEAHFRQRPLFCRFDPDCLKDYVACGTTTSDAGVKLSFDRNVESEIFRTTPHNLNCLRKKLSVPGTVIYGEQSEMARRAMLGSFARGFGLGLEGFENGGHLFPLEAPDRAAAAIASSIHRLEGQKVGNDRRG
ncbi:MAG: alpha/beta hydrolase [Chloroflexi bacterium]|nr:alpha/beta hydrolase [Chloroflexota bacterium]